jgi:hypothetical protein
MYNIHAYVKKKKKIIFLGKFSYSMYQKVFSFLFVVSTEQNEMVE